MKFYDRLSFGFFNKLPVYLQTESAECSLACLAMVASYYGHQIEVATLRQRFPLTLRGTNLKQIIEIASKLHLSSRAIRTELEFLKDVQCPAILHWDFNHFVVLKSASIDSVVIHDPAQGERRLSMAEASKHFTGIVLELQPTADFERVSHLERLKINHLWTNIQGLIPNMIYIFIFAMTLQALVLISPYFIRLVVDEIVLAQDKDLLIVLGLGFALLHIVKASASGIRAWIILQIGTILNVQLVNNLFAHLIRLPIEYFQRRHVGEIVSRFMSVDEIRKLLSNGLVEAFVDGLMVITSVIVMYVYSPILTTISVGVVLLYSLARYGLYRPHRRALEELIVKQAKEESVFLETVRTIQTIKAFANEGARQSFWQNRFTDKANANIKLNKYTIAYKTFHELVTGLEYVALIWVGAMAIMNAEFTVGMLIAFLSYRIYFSDQAQSLIDKLFEFKLLRMHLARIADITRTPKEQYLQTDRSLTEPIQGRIELRNVSYRYSEQDNDILENISLTIEPGSSVVLVGPSASGKTTLLKILMGLFQPTSGEVLVDGVNIQHIGLSNYRHATSSVTQDDHLLSGSISDNISFFDPQVDQTRIQACAVAAHIAEDILQMPMGFQTLVGDLGNTLSGGQQQRLLLARALYRAPKVLFLDEATSHLDVEMEHRISTTIAQLGMTRIMVAHRPETIAMADRLIDLTQLNPCSQIPKTAVGL